MDVIKMINAIQDLYRVPYGSIRSIRTNAAVEDALECGLINRSEYVAILAVAADTECQCIQIDADLNDARWCPVHREP